MMFCIVLCFFWVNFCLKPKVCIKIVFFFAYRYPIVLWNFIETKTISLISCFWSFIKNCPYMCQFISWLYILFHFLCIFISHSLDYCTFVICFENINPAILYLLSRLFWIDFLHFHMNFGISLLFFFKKIMLWVWLGLYSMYKSIWEELTF